MWDFLFLIKLKKNYFINLNKIDSNKIKKNYYLDYQNIIKKNKIEISSISLNFLINETIKIDKKISKIKLFLKKILKKYKIKNACWCCDPDPILANIIEYLREKELKFMEYNMVVLII